MTDRDLITILAVLCLVLLFACVSLALERTHWKRESETLRNNALNDMRYARQGMDIERNSGGEIVRVVRRVPVSMTLDEFIDSQG